MSEHLSEKPSRDLADLADENALLRAALSEMRARVEELEQRVDSDSLTGLPGRRRFLEELERVTGLADRHGTPAAVLFIDVAGLSVINERHGHVAGDAALIHVAGVLTGLIRASDVLARIGGDEFGLILDHLDHNSAIETAERLTRLIAAHPVDLGFARVSLEVSVGVASVVKGDKAAEVLLRGDRNVRHAKAGTAF
jgi:diguanylate cyclase (GGDEF)-like protein